MNNPEQELTVEEAFERINDGAFLLDVRRPDEYQELRIPGATLITLDELPSHLAELPADRQIVVQCRSGGRSAKATALLQEQGLDAVNMAGGILAWAEAELPVERG